MDLKALTSLHPYQRGLMVMISETGYSYQQPAETRGQFDIEGWLESIWGGTADQGDIAKELIRFLEWSGADMDERVRFDALYPSEGIYYLIACMADDKGLIEYGVSIWFPWLTVTGREILAALKAMPKD